MSELTDAISLYNSEESIKISSKSSSGSSSSSSSSFIPPQYSPPALNSKAETELSQITPTDGARQPAQWDPQPPLHTPVAPDNVDVHMTSCKSHYVASTFTDGKIVSRLVKALRDKDGEAAIALASEFVSCPRENPRCLPKTPSSKPDTNTMRGAPGNTDTADLDSFTMSVSVKHFCACVPKDFNVTIGGSTVPTSSRRLLEKTGLQYAGCMNGNIYLHVASSYLPLLLENIEASCLPPSVRNLRELFVRWPCQKLLPLPFRKTEFESSCSHQS